ncbi:Uncharacterised protein [Vibrio cholerae]|uniref:Uncharacterized protein n=1 Tax=Vibrio cholerae TaxID=666 RepID=A0A656A9W6_VIBCL|nr:Uncharacterised protein [Vibrio cholerae]CSA09365.1 Uncharacterised protein [Vibrio cholerae]CSA53201.1 Uncharacterised protein [Vibrio cholerae]CSB03163.1 Uncharacterised protein [Vibrio cholerae]CSB43381.1 Uncharacterised protein [Vibrio cholerae]
MPYRFLHVDKLDLLQIHPHAFFQTALGFLLRYDRGMGCAYQAQLECHGIHEFAQASVHPHTPSLFESAQSRIHTTCQNSQRSNTPHLTNQNLAKSHLF